MIDGILGWTRGNMRDRYGSGPWVLMLAEVMQRVEYPALDLGHLRVPPGESACYASVG